MLYRYRVVETFLTNGIPLEKTNGCRSLLQRSGHSLVDSSHLKSFIPKIEASEKKTITQEVRSVEPAHVQACTQSSLPARCRLKVSGSRHLSTARAAWVRR